MGHKGFFLYIYRHLVYCFCLVFVCSEYCLMPDFFLPKTSFFKSQFVYLASYLLYCISQNIGNSECFFLLSFALELWKGGRVAKIFTPIATSSIWYNENITMVHNVNIIYIMLPVEKLKEFFDNQPILPRYLLYCIHLSPTLLTVSPVGCPGWKSF